MKRAEDENPLASTAPRVDTSAEASTDGGAEHAHEHSIGEVARRTGVRESTLRMWERRFGFPRPQRRPSGQRRYSEAQIGQIVAVQRARESGSSIAAAISWVMPPAATGVESVFSLLQRRRHGHQTLRLDKRAMLSLTRAIEDEFLSQAPSAIVLGSFQRERFYRASQHRWREIARSAARAVAFADFAEPGGGSGEALEIPVSGESALLREWVVLVDGQQLGIALAGWELPGERRRGRCFETVWSVQPEAVRAASRLLIGNARRTAPQLLGAPPAFLERRATLRDRELEGLFGLTNRMIAYSQRR